jgi:hypothetical protein
MENPMAELQERVARANQAEVAKELGISPQYLSDVLNKRRELGKKILNAMGFDRLIVHVKRNRK